VVNGIQVYTKFAKFLPHTLAEFNSDYDSTVGFLYEKNCKQITKLHHEQKIYY